MSITDVRQCRTTYHCELCGCEVRAKPMGRTEFVHVHDGSLLCDISRIVEMRWELTGRRPRERSQYGSLARAREDFR